jgi:Ni,Fe-hydrogenase I cytochrome b subunit
MALEHALSVPTSFRSPLVLCSSSASNGWPSQDPEDRHALFVLQLLIATLILMGFLLYKNKDRAREFILSFLNMEFMLALEVGAAPAPAQ